GTCPANVKMSMSEDDLSNILNPVTTHKEDPTPQSPTLPSRQLEVEIDAGNIPGVDEDMEPPHTESFPADTMGHSPNNGDDNSDMVRSMLNGAFLSREQWAAPTTRSIMRGRSLDTSSHSRHSPSAILEGTVGVGNGEMVNMTAQDMNQIACAT
ncbi:unnamed protein product, partial [Symbiodinium microadriaticum]